MKQIDAIIDEIEIINCGYFLLKKLFFFLLKYVIDNELLLNKIQFVEIKFLF
jgi:hypothetical protein